MARLILAALCLLASPVLAFDAGCTSSNPTKQWVPGIGFQCGQAIPVQKSELFSATAGFNHTIPDGITLEIVSAGSLLASGTILLPANPTDGMPLSIESPNGVTVVTVQANSGQTLPSGVLSSVFGTIPTLTPNHAYPLKYATATTTWYPN